jgi:hypothetical protein
VRRYSDTDEVTVELLGRIREWIRSGLLKETQREPLLATLPSDLKRTNIFLRAILFVFGVLITAASVGLVFVTFNLRHEATYATVCICSGAVCFGLADILAGKWRLYRFGIEESLASMSVVLAAFGSGVAVSGGPSHYDFHVPIAIGLTVGMISACLVYFRFGYLYSAAAATVCLGLIPFQIGSSEWTQRLTASGLLLLVFLGVRNLWRQHRDEFLAHELSILQAVAFAGTYVALNLHLEGRLAAGQVPRPFYWFTYAMTWILPTAGLATALRGRGRPLLMVSIAMWLVSLITNKPYLGYEHQAWDPILFGLLLIFIAVVVRRWLAAGEGGQRYGFSATRILESDRRMVSIVGTASTALHAGTIHAPVTSPKLETGGGRSGGGGASGEF